MALIDLDKRCSKRVSTGDYPWDTYYWIMFEHSKRVIILSNIYLNQIRIGNVRTGVRTAVVVETATETAPWALWRNAPC